MMLESVSLTKTGHADPGNEEKLALSNAQIKKKLATTR